MAGSLLEIILNPLETPWIIQFNSIFFSEKLRVDVIFLDVELDKNLISTFRFTSMRRSPFIVATRSWPSVLKLVEWYNFF